MTRILAWFFAVLLVVLVGGLVAMREIGRPYRGFTGDEIFVDVPPGSGVSAIGRRLAERGVVRNRLAFRLAMWQHGRGRTLKAGEYRFSGEVRPAEVVDRLARGDVYLRAITFPEGLQATEMAAIYESHGLGTARDFVTAAQQPGPVAVLDAAAPDLEGYLFPETYALPRHADASTLITQMANRFVEVYDEELRKAAAARGLSTREAVTLASLIEKETSRAEERVIVSAVYHNRLRIGMGLQCDPTVIYALQKAGRWTGNLTREGLAFDSPYNTYKYRGLPPGPIAAPGRASLEAAVHPASVPYLYFVSRNDGSHVFATTLDEHNRNVHEHQVSTFAISARRRGALKPQIQLLTKARQGAPGSARPTRPCSLKAAPHPDH